MGKIGIVADNSCNLPSQMIKENEINLITLNIHFSNKEYGIMSEDEFEEFYKDMENEIPRTSCPAPGEIIKIFEELFAKEYDNLIIFPISKGMSSFYDELKMISEDDRYKNRVFVIDTNTLSVPLGFIILYACELRDKGKSTEEIVKEINRIKDTSSIYVLFGTLDQLVKGGRVGKLTGNLGNILNVKPLITIKDGEGVINSDIKVRGMNKGIERLAKELKNEIKDAKRYFLAIGYGRTQAYVKELKELLKDEIENSDLSLIAPLTPIITTHSGPEIIGAAVLILD